MAKAHDTTTYVLLRHTGQDGSSKDWAIGVGGDRDVRIRYGATGSTMRLTVIKPDVVSPVQEMNARLDKKLREGYQEIGKAHLEGTSQWVVRDDERHPPPSSSDAAPALASVHWALEHGVGRSELHIHLRAIAECLAQTVPGLDVRHEANGCMDGLAIETENGPWFIGYNGGGLFARGRGGGEIRLRDGIYPLLVIVALRHALGGKRLPLASSSGEELEPKLSRHDALLGEHSPWVTSYEEVERVAIALGLCPARLEIKDPSDQAAQPALWF